MSKEYDILNAFYSSYSEDSRLERDNAHKLEFLTTMAYLDKILPLDGTILDACAGTGVYSFALAGKGHTVTAGDLLPVNVEMIKAKQRDSAPLKEIYIGDILDLTRFTDNTFDCVLCLGALYHLMKLKDRQRALSECVRVTKNGGFVAAAYINRHAQFLVGMVRSGTEHFSERLQAYKTGGSDNFYRSSPKEMLDTAQSCGLKTMYHIGTDGIGYAISDKINAMNGVEFDGWTRHHLSTCEDGYILGYSLHALYIGQKSQGTGKKEGL